MRIGVVKEIKTNEARVGLTPAGAGVLVADGHHVLVERGAGVGAGFDDVLYEQAGAKLVSQEEAWAGSQLLVKVKEPIASEFRFLREDLTLFTYLHLAAARPLTEALLDARTLSIAYETVQDSGGLPLLAPMSEIAGRLAAHAAATHLTTPEGGPDSLARELAQADVVIGAVLVPGRAAPKVVRRDDLALLKPSALLIDVAIDQGGAFETSRPATYADPVHVAGGIRHYCVANMPGAVPQTATRALTNATLPWLRRLATDGPTDAITADPALALGVNTRDGTLVHEGVVQAFPDLPRA